ncbi:hypothetical protein FGO68_gene13753 [Halteria grandinella]|uniref:Uncharacterized protein n=1 Tax=Halteria grandinella TaxID=5974 RepID=A0A8J8NYQ1_HALGN|nr:hypothetical protein FGO68_gene13753 [Halteria grandinella]
MTTIQEDSLSCTPVRTSSCSIVQPSLRGKHYLQLTLAIIAIYYYICVSHSVSCLYIAFVVLFQFPLIQVH